MIDNYLHCVKSVRIWNFSGQYFPAFRLNTDQHNSECAHFSWSAGFQVNPFHAISLFLYPRKTSQSQNGQVHFKNLIAYAARFL